jgi:hypothetical protein
MSELQTPNLTVACPFAHTVDLLRFIGSSRDDPELVDWVPMDSVIGWLIRRLNHLTGVHELRIEDTINRLAKDEALDGFTEANGLYAKGILESDPNLWRADLRDVAVKLRELDKDGSTVRLWRKLCQKWPIFAKAAQAERPTNQAGSAKKKRGGRRRLETSKPLHFQVYDRILREHRPGEQYADIVKRLKQDRDFEQQVQDAGLKLNTKLVRSALAFSYQRKRSESAKIQKTASD